MRRIVLVLALSLSACTERAEPFTLYRNSSVDPNVRIHFATFNAKEVAADYNMTNCQMAAHLLNANIAALADADGRGRPMGLGFWCEPGGYKREGGVPADFVAKYPSSV